MAQGFPDLHAVRAALRTAGAHRRPPDVGPEGDNAGRVIWIHGVGFDEEAVVLVNHVVLHGEGRCVEYTAIETTSETAVRRLEGARN